MQGNVHTAKTQLSKRIDAASIPADPVFDTLPSLRRIR